MFRTSFLRLTLSNTCARMKVRDRLTVTMPRHALGHGHGKVRCCPLWDNRWCIFCALPIVPHGARVEMNGFAPALALVCCGECAARGRQKGVLNMKKKSTYTMSANISKEMRREVYRRDGWRCALCDSTDVLQIHHIKPRGRGGADHPMNLITLCWRCHSAAHGSLMALDEYAVKNSAYEGGESVDQRLANMAYDVELECIQYVADYYAERGEIWYPWDG